MTVIKLRHNKKYDTLFQRSISTTRSSLRQLKIEPGSDYSITTGNERGAHDILGYELSRPEQCWLDIGYALGGWLRVLTDTMRQGTVKLLIRLSTVMFVTLVFQQCVHANHQLITDGTIKCVYKDNSGNYFVAGNFTMVEGIPAHNIAYRENNTWRALGGGTDGPVNSMIVSNYGEIYIGGNFRTAGETHVNHVAKWNGVSWEALGIGTNRSVATLYLDEQDVLFVHGNFTIAGGEAADTRAIWNGKRWLTEKRAEELFAITKRQPLFGGYYSEQCVSLTNITTKERIQMHTLGSGLSMQHRH